ncbi:MAG: PilZ domain-containing protein [Gemmataceae bacterium]
MDPGLPQTFERRAFVRYRRRLETLWAYLGVGTPDLTSGEVFDLSSTGVGLVLDRSFPDGTRLVLRLPTRTLGWSSHLARVKRCEEATPGLFRVGCAFVKPLSATQLRAMLGGPG